MIAVNKKIERKYLYEIKKDIGFDAWVVDKSNASSKCIVCESR